MPAADAPRILISGATGFVGASLVRRMFERGHEVHAIVRPPKGELPQRPSSPRTRIWRVAEVGDEVKLHRIDLLDAKATRRVAAAARPQVVLHFAAHAALPQETDEAEILLHTVQPLINLVSACAGCELFINAGPARQWGLETPSRLRGSGCPAAGCRIC